MRTRPWIALVACGPVAAAGITPALAQSMAGPSLTIAAKSDERRRGISWSDGDPVLSAALSIPVTYDLSLRAQATPLWGSDRHDGADAAVDVSAAYDRWLGGWTFGVEGSYHLFPGVSGQGYGELGVNAGFLLGPADLGLFVRYAPDQRNIGGDNLYLGTSASVGIPDTPFTLSGHVGHSSGKVDDAVRAARLRPDGSYWDHGVALDWYRGRWSAGLRYADSDIDNEGSPLRRHTGASLIARIALSL